MLEIKVTMETSLGLVRAVEELRWLLSWRGKVVGYTQGSVESGSKMELYARISREWQNDDKLGYLRTWFAAKPHHGFRVTAVEPLNLTDEMAPKDNVVMLPGPV